MPWFTTEDGRRVNTEWFDKEDQQKYAQIAKNQEEADKRNGKDIFKRDKWFDQKLFDKLPKKMQVKNIISISKERHGDDGIRYNASVVWEDGFDRSISEYGWADFKSYLQTVLLDDRKYEQ